MFSKKGNTIDNLKARADGALSVFRKSYKDLIAINKEVQSENHYRGVQIKDLQGEQKALDLQFKDNEAVAKKIADIIGEEIKDA